MPRKSSFLYRILWKDAQAFYECHRLKKFVCGGTIKKIGTQAFRGAIKKDGVVLEDSLEDVEVGEDVFQSAFDIRAGNFNLQKSLCRSKGYDKITGEEKIWDEYNG